MKRVALNRGTKTLKRSSFKRKSKPKEQIEEEKKEQEMMWRVFLKVWDSNPHYSFQSGTYIGEECLTIYMHHILEKELFPEFKFCEWNICILTWSEHDQCHKDLSKVPKVEYKREWLLDKYVNNE